MQGIFKMFTTKIGLVNLYRLSQRMSLGIPSAINPHIVIVTKRSEFLMKEFFAKGLSGRKIELDEVIEPEQDEQSSTTPENVLEGQLRPRLPHVQYVVVPDIKVPI
jgi:hypothetical protein